MSELSQAPTSAFGTYQISPAARSVLDPIVYGEDAAKWGGGLLSAPTWLGGRGRSAEEIQDLVRATAREISLNPGQYRFDSGTKRFLNLDQAQLVDEGGNSLSLPGLDGGKSFVNSPEFQQSVYKELQAQVFQAQAMQPQMVPVKSGDGSVTMVPGPSLSERAQVLIQDPNFEARLTGKGATYNNKGELTQNFAGGGLAIGPMIRRAGDGSAVLDSRVDPKVAKRRIEELEKLKALRTQVSDLQRSGDLTDAQLQTLGQSTIDGVNVLRAAMLTGDPRLTAQLNTLKGAGETNRENRLTSEAFRSADVAKYGTKPDGSDGSTSGRMEIESHNDAKLTNEQTRKLNIYNAQLNDYNARLGAYQWNQERLDQIKSAKDTLALERYKIEEQNKRAQWEYAENEKQRKWKEKQNEAERLYEARNRGWGSIGNIFQMFYGNSF